MKKPRKPKPKQRHAAAATGARAVGHAGSAKTGRSHAHAPGWDHLLTRTASKPGAADRPLRGFHPGAAAKAAALSYSGDERSALGLLMLPFVIMAFAMGLTQTMKTLRHPGDTADVPGLAGAPGANPAASRAGRDIATLPQQQVATLAPPPAIPGPNFPPSDAVRAGDAPPAAARPISTAPLVSPAGPPANLAATPGTAQSLALSRAAPELNPPPVAEPAQRLAALAPAIESPAATAPAVVPAARAPAPETAISFPAAQPAELSIAAPSVSPPANERLAALIPIPGEAAITGRDMPEASADTAMPSRSICEAPPRSTAGRTLGAAIAGETPAAFGARLAAAAEQQTGDLVVYTDRYRRLAYPMGDVPALFGVCTDVVIRAYRSVGLDLQALVQQSRVGSGDASIDHRRVETLRRFFSIRGQSLKPTEFGEDYLPGDIVTYYRPQNRHSKTHIAIVSNKLGASGNPLIVHNRGWGPQVEDGLFVDEITGHYRFSGPGLPAVQLAGTEPPVKAARIGAIPAEGKTAANTLAKSAIGPVRPPRIAACKAPDAARCLARTAVVTAGTAPRTAR